MTTVLEQLRADFEALGPGAWEIGTEGTNGRVSHIGPFYGYGYDALEMFEDAPAAVWVVSAHNRMPLLLAVAEAVSDMEFAPIVRFQVDVYTIAVCGFCGARADTPELVKHFPGCHWVLAKAALSPLTEEAE